MLDGILLDMTLLEVVGWLCDALLLLSERVLVVTGFVLERVLLLSD